MPIEDVIRYLESLDYDALGDWLDYVEYHDLEIKTAKLRRRGKQSMTFLRMQGRQADALYKFRELDKSEQRATVAAASAIHRAMKPKASARDGKGNIQVKTIKRYQYTLLGAPVLDDEGNHKFKVYGPYLYLRLWVSGGDRDNSKRRYKSYYIGGENEANDRTVIYPYRVLVEAYDETFDTIPTKSGDYRRKKTPATYKLEGRILACIDIEQTPPHIDHEALKRIQAEFTD